MLAGAALALVFGVLTLSLMANQVATGLALTIFGVGVLTAGFFGGHSIASSWVGLRAETAKAQASALYLFFYYAGSSLAGSFGGWVYARNGWPGVAAFVGALSVLALLVAMKLARVPPPAHLRAS